MRNTKHGYPTSTRATARAMMSPAKFTPEDPTISLHTKRPLCWATFQLPWATCGQISRKLDIPVKNWKETELNQLLFLKKQTNKTSEAEDTSPVKELQSQVTLRQTGAGDRASGRQLDSPTWAKKRSGVGGLSGVFIQQVRACQGSLHLA